MKSFAHYVFSIYYILEIQEIFFFKFFLEGIQHIWLFIPTLNVTRIEENPQEIGE